MKPDPCPREESTIRAVRTESWSDELTAHLEKCVSCRASSRVVRWVIELADSVGSAAPSPPDAHLVWLRAHIRRRSRESARALRPIKIWSALSVIGLGAFLATVPSETWNSVSERLDLLSFSPPTTLWIQAGILVILLFLFTASEA